MNLLLQQFRDTVKAKGTGTLDKDNLVVERAEHIAGKQLVGSGKEMLGRKCEDTFLCADMRAYSQQMTNATLHTETVDLAVEVVVGHSTLIDITKDKDTSLREGSACHKVERNIEGIDIAVVRVVDENTAMLSLLHLQTHCYWFQQRHTFSQLVGGKT